MKTKSKTIIDSKYPRRGNIIDYKTFYEREREREREKEHKLKNKKQNDKIIKLFSHTFELVASAFFVVGNYLLFFVLSGATFFYIEDGDMSTTGLKLIILLLFIQMFNCMFLSAYYIKICAKKIK